jgi:peptide/nickel transport system substrate-binding protein
VSFIGEPPSAANNGSGGHVEMTTSLPRRVRNALALLVTLGIVAAACGGGGGGGGGGASPTTSGAPQRGGSVTYAIEAETTNGWCLPEAQLAIAGIQVARTIYDTLTAPNEKNEFEPWLAKSIEHNAKYDEWTIDLREGVKFHDGSDLTAEVVKNNLDAYRGAYEKLGPDGKKLRSPLLFLFVFQNIADVTVTGPLQVKVTTKVPWVAFPAYLWSSGRLGIVAQKQLDSTKCDRDLIGTGPFMLKSWRPNDHLTAERNPNWWYAKVSGKPYPYLDQITYRPIIQGSEMERTLKAGGIDIGHFSQERIIAELRDLREKGDIQMDDSNLNAEVGHVMLNASKAPFDNANARLALAYALDRKELNQILYAGIGTAASGPFPPGSVGYLPQTPYPEFDEGRAKELVQKYRDETGQPIRFTLSTTADPITQEIAQTLRSKWRAVGMDVSLDVISDQSGYISKAIGGEFQAITWRNFPGSDPDTQYVWWYDTSKNPVNFGRINDPKITADLDEARSEPDASKRKALYEDINREFARQVWNVWGTWVIWGVAYQKNIHMEGGAWGPNLPSGDKPYTGLATGHPVYAIWREGGAR